jgi:predicted metal-dependent hydrolase
LKELHRRSYTEGLPGVLQQAALLWKHHLFFEFHELLEEVWMEWRGPERPFLQGLIQLGVAFYQIQRNNYRGTMSMFRNGLAKVEPHVPGYCGVELTKFLERIEKCRQRVTVRPELLRLIVDRLEMPDC